MWSGCRRLLWGRPPPARFPRPPPAAAGSGPVGPGGGRAYAPPAERKRFYQNVSISQGEGGFEINLDHRKLKTPQAKLFTVPSEALAIAVATEWDSQKDTIKFYTMHLTTLCNTALDNPTQRNKTQLIRAAVKFLETDTVCYRVEEPAALAELQKNEWDPIVAWAEKRYNVAIGSSTSILGPNIPASTKETFISHLASYNMWALQGTLQSRKPCFCLVWRKNTRFSAGATWSGPTTMICASCVLAQQLGLSLFTSVQRARL
ncbi:ATP synthase mitochondrial F1 complex assembly factor 2 isoform X2 [Columba livia]|uniref:ATP synthase mitochondrial F1 complex assembly factor 2 isoform X2 n=1 Tax=Columba livia TaxID=8932 RepID=UPI0031BA22EC